MSSQDEKLCKKCGEVKATSEFCKEKTRKDGLGVYCRDCERQRRKERRDLQVEEIRTYHREYFDRNPEKYQNYRLMARYGITLGDYVQLLRDQGFACAICGTIPSSGDKALCVDHIHDETRRVRGLLCSYCNLIIGNAFDDPARLRASIEYLNRYANPEPSPRNGEGVETVRQTPRTGEETVQTTN